jgi:hypothetical protein
MKTCALSLLLFAMTVHAQRAPDAAGVSQLNADLMALKSLPTLPGGDTLPDPLPMAVTGREALRHSVSPVQEQVMQQYSRDLNMILAKHRVTIVDGKDEGLEGPTAGLRGKAFVSWDQAYALTSVLAGKDLSEDLLAPLSGAILGMVDSALVCLNDSSRLRDSAGFRASSEQAYKALRTLGVAPPNVEVVMGILFRNASMLVAGPPRPLYK